MSYHGGYEAILAYAAETATTATGYNQSALLTTPAISGATYIGYATKPNASVKRNNKKGFGLGSPFALYDGKGTRRYEISSDIMIPDADLLSMLVRGSGGYKNLADLCLFTGVSGTDGYTIAHRFCKCNTFSLNFQEGDAGELKSNVNWMGLFEQEVSAANPDIDDLTAAGAPYFWSNIITVNVTKDSGTPITLRDVVSNIQIQGNHNLQPRGFRPTVTGDTAVLDNTHYALLPGTFVGRATLSLHDRLGAALRNATNDATRWGDIIIHAAYADKEMFITLTNCLLDSDAQQGGESNQPMAYSAELLFDSISVSGGTPSP